VVEAPAGTVPELSGTHPAYRHGHSVVEWLLQEPRETALPYEAIVILAIVMLNALLRFVQKTRGGADGAGRAWCAMASASAFSHGTSFPAISRRSRRQAHDTRVARLACCHAGKPKRIPVPAERNSS